jgi:predicted transcriptional regulator
MENYIRELDLYSAPLRKRYGTSKFLNLHRKYRSDFEIIALILEALKVESAGRYVLMKHTGVNYAQLEKYLKTLSIVGFIRMENRQGQALFRVSERGLAFLGQYYVLLGMLLNAYSENETRNNPYEAENEASIGQQRTAIRVIKK